MNTKELRSSEVLAKIREIIESFDNSDDQDNSENGIPGANVDLGCTIKTLPTRLLIPAARTAMSINPINGPGYGPSAAADMNASVMEPLRMAIMTAKYWGPRERRLTVSFMEATPSDLRARIISHMNAWTKTGCISFVETSGTGKVRISRGAGGYYSYLGTDILHIPSNRQTMNLQGFTMNTPESEYKRVVRHETGHTLGAPHEHMRKALVARINRQKAYDYFLRTQGWDRAMVDAQVLTALDEASLMRTPADQDSIMCYQLPGSITIDGKPIRGGKDINPSDYTFIGNVYPKISSSRSESVSADGIAFGEEEWTEAEDVTELDID